MKQKSLTSVRDVKKILSEHYTDRKKGISVSLWGPDEKDCIDRIVIKFPRNLIDFIGFSWAKENILDKHGFHVAQIMGFMDDDKLWVLIVRDRR